MHNASAVGSRQKDVGLYITAAVFFPYFNFQDQLICGAHVQILEHVENRLCKSVTIGVCLSRWDVVSSPDPALSQGKGSGDS